MKRRIAVVLGAAVIAIASPAVAVADTGSASTGSSDNLAALFDALPAIWQECGLLVFTGQCGGVVTQPPV